MAKVIGHVKAVDNGTFFVKDAKGNVYQLKAGSAIHQGELVYGAPDNAKDAQIVVDVTFKGAGEIVIAGNGALHFDTSVLEGIFSQHDAIVYINSVQEAIAAAAAKEGPVIATADTDVTDAGETAAGDAVTDTERAGDVFAARTGSVADVNTSLLTTTLDPTVALSTDTVNPVILDVPGTADTVTLKVVAVDASGAIIGDGSTNSGAEGGNTYYKVIAVNPAGAEITAAGTATVTFANLGTTTGADYTPSATTVNIGTVFNAALVDDYLSDNGEQFTVSLSSNTVTGFENVVNSTAKVTSTISDITRVASVTGDTVAEGSANTFTVNLTNASTTSTTVNLSMANGSATVGTDTGTTYSVSFDGGATYSVLSGSSVVVPAGSASFKVQVATVADFVNESTETYTLTATANMVSQTGTATILNVNHAPTPVADTNSTLEDTSLSGNVLTNDTDPDSGSTLVVTQFVLNGTTYSAGAAATITGIGTIVLNSTGAYTFTPVSNWNGTVPTITYSVSDGSLSTTSTLNLTVSPVNDAPSGADKTITANEDIPYALKVTDFGFTDVDGDTFKSVTVNLPSAGTLTLNGVILSASTVVSVADIEGGKLIFTPATNASGTGYANFTFQVTDNGGTANGGVDTDPSANKITFNVNPVADFIPVSDTSIVIGANTPLNLDTTNFAILDGQSSYTYANGITVSSVGGTFSYSNGSLLGVGTPQSCGGAGIAGNEAIVFSFPTGIQSISMKLKNAANDTVMLSNDLDLTHLSNSISGTVTSTGGVFDASSLSVALVYVDSTGTHTINAITVLQGGMWSISIPSDVNLNSITKATVVSYLDGDLFNQGGNADALVSYSINTDMKNLAIAQDTNNTYSSTQLNDGFQIEYVSVNPTSNGTTVYNYPIDIYAKLQDLVGIPETFTALKLSDFPNPSSSTINVVLSDGRYHEITANGSGEYDLSAYTTLLNTATGNVFVDKMYFITSTPIDATFVPTMTIGIQDGSSTAYSIIGGTASSTLHGSDASDYISGGAGSDTLLGGAGNDTLVFDVSDTLIDGGTGTDTLILGLNANIDFSTLGNVIKNIEIIDLSQNGAHTLDKLTVQDVLDMTDSATHDLIILGGVDDTVHLQDTANGKWTNTGQVDTTTIAGHTLDIYTNTSDSTVQVKIEHAVMDTIVH